MKRLLATLVIAFAPYVAFASQPVPFTTNGTTSGTLERFLLPGMSAAVSSAAPTEGLMAESGTVTLMYIHRVTAPGVGNTSRYTLMYNEASSSPAVTCDIADLNTDCSATATLAFSPNDRVIIASDPLVGTPSNSTLTGGIVINPTTARNITLYARNGTAYSSSATQFYPYEVNSGAYTTIEGSSTQILPVAGTLDNEYIRLSGAITAGTETFNFRQNQAATSLTVAISSGASGNDTTHTASISQLDQVDWQLVPSGTPTTRQPALAARFTPSDGKTTGVFVGSGLQSLDVDSATVQKFYPLVDDNVPNSAETNGIVAWPETYHLTKFCASTTPPGGSATRTFGIHVNSATTTLTLTLSGTQANACVRGDVPLVQGSLVDVVDSPSGSPATGFPTFSTAGTDNSTFNWVPWMNFL